jgi:hypothetical protein
MIAKRIISFEYPDINPLLPFALGDNISRRHKGILKPHVQK